MKKLEHIGIAVKNLEESNLLFEKLLGKAHYKVEEVPAQKVLTSFFKVGGSKIELLASTDPEGPIARYLDKHGEGIHHVAFEVKDIYKEIERLKKEGFRLISDKPGPGADNKIICFVHPKSANGVLVELCQSIDKVKK